jgi:hypothetical protein
LTKPSFLLTPRQLDVLWEDLGLGRLPYPLDVPSVGSTAEERRRLREDVLAELGGHPDALLTDLLRLLAHHDIAVDMVAHIGRPVRAIAASDRHHAVLAVLANDKIGLAEVRPTALAKSIVDLLPENSSGPGNARTLLVQTLHRAVALYVNPGENGDDPWGDDDLDERAALVKAGLSGDDAKGVAELAANRVAGGQFGVSYSEGGVTGKRAPVLINWFDTYQGRYLMVPDGQWLSIAPTDNERITARIATVLSTVATEPHHSASIR